MAYMPASSKEPIFVPYKDPASVGLPVEIAVIPRAAGEPTDADYHPATWDVSDATLLIGAGTSLELAPGEYAVWTRLTAGSQRPVRQSGLLTVGTPC